MSEFIDHIKIPKVDCVLLLDNLNKSNYLTGTLYITSTHLIFINANKRKEIWILHLHISSIDKNTNSNLGFSLEIKSKIFYNVTFVFEKEKICDDIKLTLLSLSKPANIFDLYAFQYKPSLTPVNDNIKWSYLDIEEEYMRMGVPNDVWIMSQINNQYQICDSYPQIIYVPAMASTAILTTSAQFRSRGRLPVLSYYNIKNQAAICRCSQPLTGFNGRCLEDEALFQFILQANPSSKYMYLVDTRPKINAIANMAVGKGYESEQFYNNVTFLFLPIENIHTMRSSLQKLIEGCEPNISMSKFLNNLEVSGWLKHVKSIIDSAAFVAKAIIDGISVVVHCSDGWDRTSQVVSLASLMLDPFYRTFEGFKVLIEKDWELFGHKFLERCGHILGDSREIAPIFTQFIDCVWQLIQQFPNSFEFSESFLLVLHDNVFSCQYGNFLLSSEKERHDLRLNEKTYSFWNYIFTKKRDFKNSFYKKDNAVLNPIMYPVINPQSISFYKGLYLRFEIGLHARETISNQLQFITNQTHLLQEHYSVILKKIKIFHNLLSLNIDDDILTSKIKEICLSDVNNVIDTLGSKSIKDSDPLNGIHSEVSNLDVCKGSTCNHKNCNLIDKLITELSYISTDFQNTRLVDSCSCAAILEQQTDKIHCCHCGQIFCKRCIERSFNFPEFNSDENISICKQCFKKFIRFFSAFIPRADASPTAAPSKA